MKVILNKDLAPLGEEGDVKDVAKGYARNFLFPRGIAFPYNEKTVRLFENRREEIESRKAEKRADAAGLKEKLESLNIEITMPAGANGKLYGAVTSQTVADELSKHGYQIERKRIELAGSNIKNVGKYKVTIKLYESAAAEITISVLGQEIKTETRTAPSRPARKRSAEGAHGRPAGIVLDRGDMPEPTAEKAADESAENPSPQEAPAESAGADSAEGAPAQDTAASE